MEYSKLVAVTGLPGLFELINSKTDGAIVRSLEDSSTRLFPAAFTIFLTWKVLRYILYRIM
jgi:hypothetical protein